MASRAAPTVKSLSACLADLGERAPESIHTRAQEINWS